MRARRLLPEGAGWPARAVALLAFLVLLVGAVPASADMVWTMQGRMYEGRIHLKADGTMLLAPRRGSLANIEAGDVLWAILNEDEQQPATQAVRDRSTREAWASRDVGLGRNGGAAGGAGALNGGGRPADDALAGAEAGHIPGATRRPDGTPLPAAAIMLNGAGNGLTGPRDSFAFAYQPLGWEGRIVARVGEGVQDNPRGRAGLVIRSSLEPDALYAALQLLPNGAARFQYRQRPGEGAVWDRQHVQARGRWLKLQRSGNQFAAWISADGRDWHSAGAATLSMPPVVYIGLIASSGSRAARWLVPFHQVSISGPWPQPLPESSLAVLAKGVVLRDGTAYAAAEIESADAAVVVFTPVGGQKMRLATDQVAQLVLAPLPYGSSVANARRGVLLRKGDFIEGQFKDLAHNQVRISSVLFGLSRFIAGMEAAAIVLNDVSMPQADVLVRCRDGSVRIGHSLRFAQDAVSLQDEAGTWARLPVERICEIAATGRRAQWLADLPPAQVEHASPGGRGQADAGAKEARAAASGGAMVLAGRLYGRGLRVPAGASLRYNLDGQYESFVCQIGVPGDVPPGHRIRFMLDGDGRPLLEAPIDGQAERGSSSDPVPVVVRVRGVRQLTLRVELAAEGDPGPAAGVWAGAALLRRLPAPPATLPTKRD